MLERAATNYRRITARGRYEPQFQILIDNRTHNGQAGYHVVTPLRVEGSDIRLLVNRGWIPAPAERRETPLIETPAGVVETDGIAARAACAVFHPHGDERDPPRRMADGVAEPRSRALRKKRSASRVQPVVLQLDPRAASGGFVRDWPQPDEKRPDQRRLRPAMVDLRRDHPGVVAGPQFSPPTRTRRKRPDDAMPAMTSIPLPSATSAPKRGRFTLALLVATFVLPFLAGTGLFWSGWRPEKFGNHGELIVAPSRDAGERSARHRRRPVADRGAARPVAAAPSR